MTEIDMTTLELEGWKINGNPQWTIFRVELLFYWRVSPQLVPVWRCSSYELTYNYSYRGYIKAIIEIIPISRLNNVAEENWSVGRPAGFRLGFSSGSTVLFRIQKKHYMAIYFWKNNFYTYYYDHIVNPTVPDLYIHLGRVIFHITEVFFAFSHFHEHGLHHFDSLKYPGFLPTQTDLGFF